MKILTRRKFHDVRHFVCSPLRACAHIPLAAFCRAAPPCNNSSILFIDEDYFKPDS